MGQQFFQSQPSLGRVISTHQLVHVAAHRWAVQGANGVVQTGPVRSVVKLDLGQRIGNLRQHLIQCPVNEAANAPLRNALG